MLTDVGAVSSVLHTPVGSWELVRQAADPPDVASGRYHN